MEEATATSPVPAPQSPASEQKPPSADDASVLTPVEVVGGIGQYPVTSALKELVDAGVRGQSGMVLLYTLIQKLESDLKETRDEVKELRNEAEKWKTDYYTVKQEKAVLDGQLTELKRHRTLQNIIITLGGIVEGVAVPYLISQPTGASVAVALLGLILLMLGWIRGGNG
jgi:hypothetical protein